MKLVLPNDEQRHYIAGKTGSGKTHFALWELSQRSFTTKPWVIIDFKRDKLIQQIDFVQEIGLNEVPVYPGLYVVRPIPGDDEKVDKFLWSVWKQENVGIFIDEGYMIGTGDAFPALLTQGRSKNIPLIVLTQRPVWISRFVYSESDFFSVFWLNDERDRKTIQSFIPYDLNERLPTHYSLWYDVNRDKVLILRPVPPIETVLATFAKRLNDLQPKKAYL